MTTAVAMRMYLYERARIFSRLNNGQVCTRCLASHAHVHACAADDKENVEDEAAVQQRPLPKLRSRLTQPGTWASASVGTRACK
jgi:hypothetical protein